MSDKMIERAYVENRAFDCLQPWKIFHPRTFWQMVGAVADMLEAKPPAEIHIGEFGNGTGTNQVCSIEIV